MKKLVLILIAITMAVAAFSQVVDSTEIVITPQDELPLLEDEMNNDEEVSILGNVKVISTNDVTRIIFPDKEIIISEDGNDEDIVILDKQTGKRSYLFSQNELDEVREEIEGLEMEQIQKDEIIESIEQEMEQLDEELADIDVEVEDIEDEDSDWADFDFRKGKHKDDKFEGHWASFEFGINNLVDNNFSSDYDPEWLQLNTSKSWNVNLNLAQQSINIIHDRVGIVTGFGIEWNGYNLDGKNNVKKENGVLVPDSTYANFTLKKNKFKSTYFTVPIILEVHPSRNEDFYFSAGVIGGVKISNSQKVVYYNDDNDKVKAPRRRSDDLNLRTLRYGVIAKVGFDVVDIYARYYLSSIFESKDDPELYPFTIGLAVNF